MSDQPLSNIDWTLNQLLSADRESRQYATKAPANLQNPAVTFAPWQPRKLARGDAEPETAAPVEHDQEGPPSDEAELTHNESTVTADEQTIQPSVEDRKESLSKSELESVRKAAFDAGFVQARQQLHSQTEIKERELDSLIDSLNQDEIDVQGQYTSLVSLAVFIAEQALRVELTHSQTFINDLAERCIKEIRRHGGDRISIRMSVHDFESTDALQASHSESIDFIKDKSLATGDLKLVMGYTEIDETMRHKLQTLANALLNDPQQLPPSEATVPIELIPL